MRRNELVRAFVRGACAGVIVGIASVPVSVVVAALTPWHTTTVMVGSAGTIAGALGAR
jgi:hypothetical protein